MHVQWKKIDDNLLPIVNMIDNDYILYRNAVHLQ